MTPPVALTIAGSDSGSGAGLQADLKSMAAHEVFATTAVTAVTFQNTVEVRGVHVLPPEAVDAQIGAVLDDFDVRAVKTGMLATAEIIEVVAARADAGDLPNLVVDPVMVAASGDRLLDEAAETAYLDRLFPRAMIVTPNLREAGVLVGRPVLYEDDMTKAAEELAAAGPAISVITGGHLGDDAVDVIWAGGRRHEMRRPRVHTPNVHGTGCTFASATAAGLARGREPLEALEVAKDYVTRVLQAGARWQLGAGHGPVDHFEWEETAHG